MVSRRLALAFAVALASSLCPLGARADAPAHAYTLEAHLDADRHAVEGRGTIRWTNESAVPIDALYLHLYLNAFEGDETVFMRESGGQLRRDRFEGPGGITVSELSLDGEDLLAGADDELIEGDRTQLRVPLPAPVAPNASIEMSVVFTAELPRLFARAGYVEDFHMVAQWFPKLARLEPDGRWSSFPYHGLGEFYADFARYDVQLDVPEGYVVGATGAPVTAGGAAEPGRTRHRYVAERVHDFAWLAAPGLEHTTVSCEGVDVVVLAPPELAWAAARARFITCEGLARLGRLYGPYPYARLTVIVPPDVAGGAAGMEYPTLFTTIAEPIHVPILHVGGVEETTAHELAHQWFQGLVATHETRWPMLDEGLTSWATYDLLGAIFGRDQTFLERPAIDAFELARTYSHVSSDPPPARHVEDFGSGSYFRVIYGRVPLVFETIARTYGRERVHAALGVYARRHRFAHPDPDDLFAAFEEEFGPFIVSHVLRPALFEGADAAVALVRDQSGIVAVRRGTIALPSRIHVRCTDGREHELAWPAARARLAVTPPPGCDIAIARVNVYRHNLLDPRLDDDALEPTPRRRWATQLLGWAQLLFAIISGP